MLNATLDNSNLLFAILLQISTLSKLTGLSADSTELEIILGSRFLNRLSPRSKSARCVLV